MRQPAASDLLAAGIDVVALHPPAQTRLGDPQISGDRCDGFRCASRSRARRRNSSGCGTGMVDASWPNHRPDLVSGIAGEAPCVIVRVRPELCSTDEIVSTPSCRLVLGLQPEHMRHRSSASTIARSRAVRDRPAARPVAGRSPVPRERQHPRRTPMRWQSRIKVRRTQLVVAMLQGTDRYRGRPRSPIRRTVTDSDTVGRRIGIFYLGVRPLLAICRTAPRAEKE